MARVTILGDLGNNCAAAIQVHYLWSVWEAFSLQPYISAILLYSLVDEMEIDFFCICRMLYTVHAILLEI